MKASTGYEDLVKGFGWRFDFKSSNWTTYKANVLKWAGCEDDERLIMILETRWDQVLEDTREALELQAPEKKDGKNTEAEVKAFEALQLKHKKKMDELPTTMRKLKNRVGRMFLTTLGTEASTYVNDVSDPYEIWTKLTRRFEGEGAPTAIAIHGQIAALKYARGSDVALHVEALNKLFEALKDRKEPMSESLKCSTLMNSVRHLSTFTAWLTSENALATIPNHVADFREMSRRLLSLTQIDGALKNPQLSTNYFNGKERKIPSKSGPGFNKTRKGNRCYNCGKEDGHFAADVVILTINTWVSH